MIQRIQTIYWFLSTVLLVVFYISDFAFIKPADASLNISIFYGISCIPEGLYESTITFLPLHILLILSAFLTFVTIFFFKRRILQIRLSVMAIVLNVGLLGISYFYYYHISSGIEGLASLSVTYILPLIASILDILAIFGVRKDISILRSLTRL
jgi:hypothetical protein